MCGGLLRDWWEGHMRKSTLTTPPSGIKGLQPLVAANFSFHFPSSLQGSVQNVFNNNSVHLYHIPEAISLHRLTHKSFLETFIKITPLEVRAGRLLRRWLPATDTITFISEHFTSKTLLAMTNKGNGRVQVHMYTKA
jgi:hypothetical protein